MKDTTQYIALLFTLSLIGLCWTGVASANDNEISIKQTGGNNLALQIEQLGVNNKIKMYDTGSYLNGADMTLKFVQENDTTVNNVIELWHLAGNNNTIRWGQGVAWSSATSETWTYDSDEGGGHYARLDIHGTDNHLQGHQTNQGSTSGHTFNSLIFSNDNDIWVRQQGDGAKTINLTTTSNGNDITLRQKGHNANHSATINLSGSYGTALTLLQQSTTTQSYSLSQSCVTVGGCTLSVTQGTP